jgi:hypothetical protein
MAVNTIVHVSRPGPCLAPVTVTTGRGTAAETTVLVDCARRLLSFEQCRNCRHRVFVNNSHDGSGQETELPHYLGF